MLEAGIIVLTIIYLVADYSTALGSPRLVGSDNLARTILIENLNLAYEARCAVTLHPMGGDVVESVAKNHTDCIFTLREQFLHIIREVHNGIFAEWIGNNDTTINQIGALVVIGLVGREIILANALTIYI